MTKTPPPMRVIAAVNLPRLKKFRVRLSCGHTMVCAHELDSARAKTMVCVHGCTKELPDSELNTDIA